MNLYGIDVGNTRIKIFRLPARPVARRASLFEAATPLEPEYAERDVSRVLAAIPGAAATRCHVLSVDARLSTPLVAALRARGAAAVHWGFERPLPVAHGYAAPARPGDDRLLAALAATLLFPEESVVVVGAGTALTVDLAGPGPIHRGGAIAPGLGTLSWSLGEKGAQLFDVGRGAETRYPGRSTREALALGVAAAFGGALRALVDQALATSPDARIVVFGGDAARAVDALDRPAVVRRDDLMAIGFAALEDEHAGRS